MLERKTAALRMLHPLLSYLRTTDADVAPIFKEFKLSLPFLLDPDSRIPQADFFKLFRRIAELVGDPAVGVQAAAKIPFGAIRLMKTEVRYLAAQLCAASATVDEGVRRFVQCYPLAHDTARFSLKRSGDVIHLDFTAGNDASDSDPIGVQVFTEYSVSVIALMMRAFGGPPVIPPRIYFSHPRPESAADYESLLGTPVAFAAKNNGFALTLAQLATPLVTADPEALAQCQRHADELQAKQASARGLSSQVKAAVLTQLQAGTPTAELVAKRLGMSVRTLTRRLRDEQTSYQALLDEVRAKLAHKYLAEQKMGSDELALRLGFSETSAFLRAFRRWNGKSVTDYRRSNG